MKRGRLLCQDDVLTTENMKLFWCDSWLPGGLSLQDMFPALFSFAGRSEISVADAIQNRR
jgi:hypothetical protein